MFGLYKKKCVDNEKKAIQKAFKKAHKENKKALKLVSIKFS
jgi:hypothetical protein